MNLQETTVLVRLLRSVCPAQRIDEHTADLWQPILAAYNLDECMQALNALAARQNFISSADLVGEVKRTRASEAEEIDSQRIFSEARQPRRASPPPAEWLAARDAAGMPSAAEALAVKCPWCRAPAGSGCVVPGHTKGRRPHEARWLAAGLEVPAEQTQHYRTLARKVLKGTGTFR